MVVIQLCVFCQRQPERLFARDGLLVASEAVAGTRARGGTVIKDLQLGMELMQRFVHSVVELRDISSTFAFVDNLAANVWLVILGGKLLTSDSWKASFSLLFGHIHKV